MGRFGRVDRQVGHGCRVVIQRPYSLPRDRPQLDRGVTAGAYQLRATIEEVDGGYRPAACCEYTAIDWPSRDVTLHAVDCPTRCEAARDTRPIGAVEQILA